MAVMRDFKKLRGRLDKFALELSCDMQGKSDRENKTEEEGVTIMYAVAQPCILPRGPCEFFRLLFFKLCIYAMLFVVLYFADDSSYTSAQGPELFRAGGRSGGRKRGAPTIFIR